MNATNRMFRIAFLAAILLVMATACAAFPQQGADPTGEIAGTYYVNGVDSREIEYGGRLEITTADEPDHYDLQWIITGSVQLGTGVLDGDVLSAEWSTIQGFVTQDGVDHSSGTVTYTIASDGTLNGIRTTAGLTETGTEEAFPVKP